MAKNQTKSILSFTPPPFLLGVGVGKRCVSVYVVLLVCVHGHSSNAGPLLCLMFAKLCRRYLKNWLHTVWNHSTDLLPHEKTSIPQGTRSETY